MHPALHSFHSTERRYWGPFTVVPLKVTVKAILVVVSEEEEGKVEEATVTPFTAKLGKANKAFWTYVTKLEEVRGLDPEPVGIGMVVKVSFNRVRKVKAKASVVAKVQPSELGIRVMVCTWLSEASSSARTSDPRGHIRREQSTSVH